MGCKCKETADAVQKYTDDSVYEEESVLGNVVSFFSKTLVVILIASILIVCTPFIIGGVMMCVFTGKEINFKKLVKNVKRK